MTAEPVSPAKPWGDDLLRELAPRVLAALIHRYGQFGAAEDAVQESLLAAAQQWPTQGVPHEPFSWLLTVASRRLIDQQRSERARQQRELAAAALEWPYQLGLAPGPEQTTEADDTLLLLLLCCHPALSPASQLALTLRAVGGLSTAAVAKAFLVPEATMAQRISRAKQTIKAAGARFELPPPQQRAQRLRVVLHVLYLMFNEGYTVSTGTLLHDCELINESIRLTRLLHRLVPADGEVAGLLALLLLTDARRRARTDDDGGIVPLAHQRRELWDQGLIEEGTGLLRQALAASAIGPYQIQAAICALHDEAPSAARTDWPQILALYELLEQVSPSPMVTLNRAVAVAMTRGPGAGLALLDDLDRHAVLAGNHRLPAVRAHLLELAGDHQAALTSYAQAARMTTNLSEVRYLRLQTDRLTRVLTG